jgi:hypothetical protein
MCIYKYGFHLLLSILLLTTASAQTKEPAEEEEEGLPVKIMHAEPLYIDLIRDLGARKGEKEWNVGMGMTDNFTYDSYQMLVEYEFAPINRLGVEFEVPITFYTRNSRAEFIPSHRIESFKSAAQYTFLIHKKARLSAAIGYLNEMELESLDKIGRQKVFTGNLVNPFLVVAKDLVVIFTL